MEVYWAGEPLFFSRHRIVFFLRMKGPTREPFVRLIWKVLASFPRGTDGSEGALWSFRLFGYGTTLSKWVRPGLA